VIAEGWAKIEETVMANDCRGEEPQLLLAVTEMFPPDAFAVVVILFIVLVPVHPPGTVQE
jgi:hypothetical protein